MGTARAGSEPTRCRVAFDACAELTARSCCDGVNAVTSRTCTCKQGEGCTQAKREAGEPETKKMLCDSFVAR